VLGTRGEERNRVLAIFIVVFFVIFFWAAYEQAGSSMNLFADKNTDLSAPGWLQWATRGVRIPASWFQSVNPVVLIASAPLFAMLWPRLARAGREPSTGAETTAAPAPTAARAAARGDVERNGGHRQHAAVRTQQPTDEVQPVDVLPEQLPDGDDQEVADGMVVEGTATGEAVLQDVGPGATPFVVAAQGSQRHPQVTWWQDVELFAQATR